MRITVFPPFLVPFVNESRTFELAAAACLIVFAQLSHRYGIAGQYGPATLMTVQRVPASTLFNRSIWHIDTISTADGLLHELAYARGIAYPRCIMPGFIATSEFERILCARQQVMNARATHIQFFAAVGPFYGPVAERVAAATAMVDGATALLGMSNTPTVVAVLHAVEPPAPPEQVVTITVADDDDDNDAVVVMLV